MSDLVIKNHDPTLFPVFEGLVKPPKASVKKVIRMNAMGGRYLLSPSPFHGVTRLSVLVGSQISQTFNNGKGDAQKKGRYLQAEATGVVDFIPGAAQARICWKVRNTYGIKKVIFELFAKGNKQPIWSLTWDTPKALANLLKNSLVAGSKEKDGQTVPIKWSGSMNWVEAVAIDHPDFPDGRLTTDHSPYQLRLTINDGNSRYPKPADESQAQPLGYPLIAWTYIHVPSDADAVELDKEPSTGQDEEEFLPLSLLVEEKAGVEYTLDDGVNSPSTGQVSAEGILVHPVSARSTGCAITFKDDGQQVKIPFDQTVSEEPDYWDEFEKGDDWRVEDEEAVETLEQLADPEDEPPLITLLVPDKAGVTYTLDDGVNPLIEGVVDEDGLLIQPVPSQVQRCTIKFKDNNEEIELLFS